VTKQQLALPRIVKDFPYGTWDLGDGKEIGMGPLATWEEVLRSASSWALIYLPRILLILVLAMLVTRASRRVVRRFETHIAAEDIETTGSAQRATTLATLLGGAISVVVWLVASLQILAVFSINIAPVLASAGIAGVALGFGAQSLVRDFFTGFFILLEGQYRVGDWLELSDNLEEGGIWGVVERFSLRRTSIRGRDGTLHHIANGEIHRASNASAQWSTAIIDIDVPAGEPIPKVTDALLDAGVRLAADPQAGGLVLEAPKILGLEDLSGGSMSFRVSLKTVPGQRRSVARVYRRWVKQVFDEVGIDLDPPDDVVIRYGDGRLGHNGTPAPSEPGESAPRDGT
jgi:moderate conductance mechanosensitive channel